MQEVMGDKSKGHMGMITASPNTIGDVEDAQSVRFEADQSYPGLNTVIKEEQMSMGDDSAQFKDITSTLTRTRRNNSKSRK